jgi:AcrR family transcriptional regulator
MTLGYNTKDPSHSCFAFRLMPARTSKKALISARKRPVQARSERLVADVLEAAARVLARQGARHFTTVRVAEEAGVSIGSLYQYFPSKEALLFRLQTDEWSDTWGVLDEILSDARLAPLDRLSKAVLVFFRSEQQEAALRVALDDAGALFRDAPEAHQFLLVIKRRMLNFFEEALPGVPAERQAFTSEVVLTAMAAVAEKVTAQGLDRRAVDAWAKANAEMYCAYVESVAKSARRKAR